jgi:RNA polymerase sigma factor (sigma-70 family)
MNKLIISQIESYWVKLSSTKDENNKESFNSIMLTLIPEIRKYLNHSLKVQLKKGNILKEKHKVDEFINDLFIEAYDTFSEFDNYNEFSNWLYTKLDEIIEDASVQDQFDDLFFKNIDSYTQVEWDSMEEEYTVDGGGDFVMKEELDVNSSSDNYSYALDDVFIEKKDQELIEEIDQALNNERINKHINMVLYNLPISNRNLFDLAVTQKLSLDNIAKVKKLSVNKVDTVLNEIRDNIRMSFAHRYKVNT